MCNISVHRYPDGTGKVEPDGSITREWDGWVEPDDKTWIVFVNVDGSVKAYLDRDPVTGAVREAAAA